MRMKKDELQFLSQKLIPSCEERVADVLRSEPFNFNPKFISIAVHDIVHKGKRIFDNAEQCSSSSEEKRARATSLYNMTAVCRKPVHEGFLIMAESACMKQEKESPESVDAVPFKSELTKVALDTGVTPLTHLYPNLSISDEQVIVRNQVHVDSFQSSHLTAELEMFFTSKAVLCQRIVIVLLNITDGLMKDTEKTVVERFTTAHQQTVLPFVLDIVEFQSEQKEVKISTFTSRKYSKVQYLVTLPKEEDNSAVNPGLSHASPGSGYSHGNLKSPQQKESAQCIFSVPSCDPTFDVVGNLEQDQCGFDYVDAV